MAHSSMIETKPNSSEHGEGFAEFFQENNGQYSAMRAMSFIALIAAIVFGAIAITTNNSAGKDITTAFLAAAFAPKAIQRFAEGSPPK
ncbi:MULTISPECIES: hypothetical protein [unclassified Microcoleus]|uniref:hypothetical protein n=1 Tax=unclassified Microcoleus TaxID=2642155 RepID=UPI001D37EA8F|nr:MULTISPECIES: hypothetical protein [unclassified Microcoleus]MCC3466397.1 hypothetical protein [Microcoleus sp. PH2017_06_SFM_O_A]MCC3413124.1 hypothetical protein [Microcoleus sp. PH2017_02_FOX_O_A]MCC3435114.1 hypothetical protein [Microcoleus sp. PH2017_05_CCC_O_A]MCC3498426.1 hypothetical protein [Microcoleus sp. PH2017_15_JOR_U_A]MCC3564751.1 hypothetical protein [Microcoleus sp. PH2017_31_RDM_U_A]